jgi:hypothetical protein
MKNKLLNRLKKPDLPDEGRDSSEVVGAALGAKGGKEVNCFLG